MRFDETANAITEAARLKRAGSTPSGSVSAPVYGGERSLGGTGTRTSNSSFEAAQSSGGLTSSGFRVPIWESARVWEFGWKRADDGSTSPSGEKAGSRADVRVIEAQRAANLKRGGWEPGVDHDMFGNPVDRPSPGPEFGRRPDVKHYTEEEAEAEFGALLQNPEAIAAWGKIARLAGLLDADEMNDASKLEEAWKKAIGWSFKLAKASGGNTLFTPFEAAQMVAENTGSGFLAQLSDAQAVADAAERKRKYDQEHFTGTKNLVTSTDIDTNAGERNLENLRQLLGRNPTAGEEAAFNGGMNAVAKANPTVTKRVGTFKDGEQTAQTNTVSGGIVDEAGAVRKSASSSSPEVDANQRATTYYDALTKAARAAI